MELSKEQKVEVPLASLIDIVFLLIIFFVVTASMQNEALDREIKLAKSSFVAPPVTGQTDPMSVTLNITTRFGDIRYNIAQMPVTLPQFERLLRANLAARNGETFPVIIRADADVRYKEIEKVTEVLGKVGIWQVLHSSESEWKNTP